MPLTELDIAVLELIARYYVITREQIQQMLFPDHVSGRCTRKRLNKLRKAGYITNHKVQICPRNSKGAAPVYYPTRKAAALLAEWFSNDYYLYITTKTPRADRLHHWIAASECRMLIERATSQSDLVQLAGYINEWAVVNPTAGTPDQYFLQTQFTENPPLSCSPDAAFLIDVRGHKKVFYLEVDLGTSSPKQIAARKTKGYAELAAREGHRRHFPTTTLPGFSVLMFTPNLYRCEAIGKELSSKNARPDLWLLIDQSEVTVDNFLHEPIVYDHQGRRAPLVKPFTPSS